MSRVHGPLVDKGDPGINLPIPSMADQIWMILSIPRRNLDAPDQHDDLLVSFGEVGFICDILPELGPVSASNSLINMVWLLTLRLHRTTGGS
jgi:hypothetical protein